MLPPPVLKAVTISLFVLLGLLLTAALRAPDGTSQYLPRLSSNRPKPIPSVVHYTYLKKTKDSGIHFSFENFLSLYAALVYIKPTTIYIHTDHNASYINETAVTGSKWTRKILSHPQVKINHVTTITHTNGKQVENVEAKSDFVRWDIIYEFGGIYIDWDVLTLRDVRVLREAGFRNVVGRQGGGKINSGCFMSQVGSSLAYLMKRDQYKAFDGAWETHAVDLVTKISERLSRSPGEVLILDEKAMAPTGWWTESNDELFGPHNDTSIPLKPQVNDPTEDPMQLWDNKARAEDWEMDFSQTYFLHAFKSRGHDVPGFDGVSVQYILARNSNYALAAWPIVQLALKDGVLSEEDDEI
jgi:hypothetical protein